MYIPTHSSHHHHHHTTGGTHHSPKVHHDLINNPITVEIIMMIVVVSFAMLLVKLVECLQPFIAPDPHPEEEEYDDDAEEQQPWNFTLTEDGTLVDNDSGRSRQYGTFYTDGRSWYNADGYVFTTCQLSPPPRFSQKY